MTKIPANVFNTLTSFLYFGLKFITYASSDKGFPSSISISLFFLVHGVPLFLRFGIYLIMYFILHEILAG